MFRDGIPARQLSAWLAAGMIPVLIQLLSGTSWVWVFLGGAASTAITLTVWRFGAEEYPRWLRVLQMLFAVIFLGEMSAKAGGCWPAGNSTAVSLILIALAMWSAQKGLSAAARVGTVLFWFVIIMYMVVFGAGAKDIDPKWLKPDSGAGNLLGLALLLLPCGVSVLLRRQARWGVRLVLPAVFALAAALITAGVLSPELAVAAEDPFYEMGRSLSLLGIARRFEAIISAGMTVGWFALISLLLALCGKLFACIYEDKGRAGVWIGAVLSSLWLLCGMHIGDLIIAILAAVFWVVLPILTQGIDKQKKS